jgi:hypothetical protein
MAVALTVLGAFSAIYHPVRAPMLVQGSARPGRAIGFNGLAGDLGHCPGGHCPPAFW